MNTIQLQTISWPVFRLGEKQPNTVDNVIYYSTEYSDLDTQDVSHSLRLVDDKSIDKPTLGLRRLVLAQTAKLFPIGTAVYFLADLIKLAKPTTWWIDSTGRLFQYKKSTRAKLTTHKITQVLPAGGLGCVLEIEGLVTRFKSMQRPQTGWYAAVLSFGGAKLLYGYSEKPLKPSWRLV